MDAPRKDNRISSQPEADEILDADLIIPWPVVGAVVCVVAFFVVSVPLAGQSAAAFDSFFVGNACNGFAGMDRPGALAIALTNRLFNHVSTGIFVSGAVLAWAFARTRTGAAAQILLGPIPAVPVQRKTQLRGAEVLIGVLAVVWLSCLCANRLVQRHGPVMDISSLPDMFIVGAVAFWGTFASLSWRMEWRAAWRWIGTALFIVTLALSLISGAYTCRDWPSDIVASLLLGGAILCTALYALDTHL